VFHFQCPVVSAQVRSCFFKSKASFAKNCNKNNIKMFKKIILIDVICRRFGILCLFHFHRQIGACRMNLAGNIFGVLYGKRFGSEMA